MQGRRGLEGILWHGIEIEKSHCPIACHHLGFEAQGHLEIDIIVMKEQASLLKHIDVNGTLPGQTRPLVSMG